MRTDPLGDAWDFLFALQADALTPDEFRLPLTVLFWALLLGSGAVALVVWRRDATGPGPFWSWLFRALVGIMWFRGALEALPFPVSDGLRYWVERMVADAAWPWFSEAVQDVLLPNLSFAGPAIFVWELAVAVSLMLGLFVRPLAVLTAIYVLVLGAGLYRAPDEWPWGVTVLAALHGMFAVVGGRNSLGLDALLPHFPSRLHRRAT